MLETLHDSVIAPARARLGARGLGTGLLAALALSLGVAAAVAVTLHAYLLGLALFALGRAAALIGYTPALSTFDLAAYGALAFGFALAEPDRALASSFAMFGFVILAVSRLAFARNRPPLPRTSLIASAIAFVALALACVRPDYFSLVAYAGGLACFLLAGVLAASAVVRT